MFLIQIFIHVICLNHAFSYNLSPGVPLPHADELDRILSRTVFANSTDYNTNTVFQYLFGDNYNFTELDDSETFENLDISILDADTLSKIVQAAKKKELELKPSRRDEEIGKAYEFSQYFSNKTIEFMRQSIYDTRRRLIATRPIRKKYHSSISYNIGIIYGALMQMRMKLEHVYTALKKTNFRHELLWNLLLYERCVTLSVDIEFSVQRMFDFQKKWRDLMRPDAEDNDYESRNNPQLPPNLEAAIGNLPPDVANAGNPGG